MEVVYDFSGIELAEIAKELESDNKKVLSGIPNEHQSTDNTILRWSTVTPGRTTRDGCLHAHF